MRSKTARLRSSARIFPISSPAPSCRLQFIVELAGRKMQEDFLPILERQIHHLINYAQGLMHIGQRDISWIRLAKQAVEKGFTLQAYRAHSARHVP